VSTAARFFTGDQAPDLVLAFDRFREFGPCQHGGIVAS